MIESMTYPVVAAASMHPAVDRRYQRHPLVALAVAPPVVAEQQQLAVELEPVAAADAMRLPTAVVATRLFVLRPVALALTFVSQQRRLLPAVA